MDEFAAAASESVKDIGRGFIIAYVVPALLFVLVNVLVLSPRWGLSLDTGVAVVGTPPLSAAFDLSSFIYILLVSLVLAVLLAGLNDLLIRLLEGKVWWLQQGLLKRRWRQNKEQSEKFYGPLLLLQNEYWRVSTKIVQAVSADEKMRLEQLRHSVAQQIKEEQKKTTGVQRLDLPRAPYRVAPTLFGNVYALAEEYAYERYGIDTVLFWPRLVTLLTAAGTSIPEQVSHHKVALDLRINVTFVFAALAGEGVLTLLVEFANHGRFSITLFVLTIAGLLLTSSFYASSIRSIGAIGDLVKLSFDFHRNLILNAFEIQPPKDLSVEQIVWIRLAQFITEGNEFYLREAREIAANSQKPDQMPLD